MVAVDAAPPQEALLRSTGPVFGLPYPPLISWALGKALTLEATNRILGLVEKWRHHTNSLYIRDNRALDVFLPRDYVMIIRRGLKNESGVVPFESIA